MAFPSIGTPVASSNTTNATTLTVNLPASIAAGDLIIVAICSDSAALSHSAPSPWVEIKDETFQSVAVASVYYLIASGGETSVVITRGATERGNALAWRITGWHGTTPPEITAAATSAGSANPDPPSLTPSWGSADTLWMALAFWDDSATPTLTSHPTNYTLGQGNSVAGTSAGRLAGSARQVTAASEDPGTFTISASEQWNAYTLAIRPTAGTTFTQSLSGSLSFSGSIAKQGNKSLTGALSFSGSFSKQTNKALAGALSFAGSIAKRTNKALAGGLSFSGALATSRVFLKSLTGTLSFSGSLAKQTNKPLAGVLSFSGSIAKRTNKSLAGGLSFAGAFSKQTGKALAGGLSFSGAISKRTDKALTGGLSFSGSLVKQTAKSLAGGLFFAGNLGTNWIAGGTTYFKSFTANLSFSGSLGTSLIHFRVIDALSRTRIAKPRFPWYGRGIRRR